MDCVYCHKLADNKTSAWLVNDADMNNDEICHHKCLQNMLQTKDYIGMIRSYSDRSIRYGGNMKLYAYELNTYKKDCDFCHKKYLGLPFILCYFSDKSIYCHRKCLRNNLSTMPDANGMVGIRKCDEKREDVLDWSDLPLLNFSIF